MNPRGHGATENLPAPEFVVLCSSNEEWRTHAEVIAKRGRPMLLVTPTAADMEFLEGLAQAHSLSKYIDPSGERLYFWRPDATLNA
jgi:hypothetical protein